MNIYGASTTNIFTGDVFMSDDLSVGGDLTVGGDIDFTGDVVIAPPGCLDTDCVQEITPSSFSLRAATGPAVLNIVDGEDINIYRQIHVDVIRSSTHQDPPDADGKIEFLFSGIRMNSGGATALLVKPGGTFPTVAMPGITEATDVRPFAGTQDVKFSSATGTEIMRTRSANDRLRVGTIGSHYDMPGADGAAGFFLRTNGAGDATWAAADPPAAGPTFIDRQIFTAVTTTTVYPKGVLTPLFQPTVIGDDAVNIADFPQNSIYTLRCQGYWNGLNANILSGTGTMSVYCTNSTGAFVLFERDTTVSSPANFQEYGYWEVVVTVIRFSPTAQICRASFIKNSAADTTMVATQFDTLFQTLAVGPGIRAQAFWTDDTSLPMVLTPIMSSYRVTLSTPTAAGINQVHNTLLGITPGDAGHTSLALLTGRAGGQFLRGGTAPGEALALQGSSGGGGTIQCVSDVRLDTGFHLRPQTQGVSDLGSQTLYMRNLWGTSINLSPIGVPFTLGNDAELPVIPAHRYISIYAQSNGDATSFPGGGEYSFIEGKTTTGVSNGMDTNNAGRIINLGPDANFRVSFTGTILPQIDDDTYSFLVYVDGAPVDGSYVSTYIRNQPSTAAVGTHVMVFVPNNGHIQMACTSFSGDKFTVVDYSFSAEVLL